MDKYQFADNILGKGAFSVVYEGTSPTGDKVAIKCLNRSVKSEAVANELAIIKRLSHPHIIKCLDFYQDDRGACIVYEYCNGGDLISWIKQRIAIPSRTDFLVSAEYTFIKGICEGLVYLHANQIIHRDLKPHNILISNNIVKIGDFGLARSFNNTDDMFSTMCGSPMYMAPETILFKPYGTSCDIWSLGVIIFELITKRHPYPYSNRRLLMEKVQTMVQTMGNAELDIVFTSISAISEDITRLLRQMMNRDPALRPSSASVMEFFNSLAIPSEDDASGSFRFMEETDVRTLYETITDAPPSTPEGCRPRSLSNIAVNERFIEEVLSSSPSVPTNYILGSTPPQHCDLFTSLGRSFSKIIGIVKKPASYP